MPLLGGRPVPKGAQDSVVAIMTSPESRVLASPVDGVSERPTLFFPREETDATPIASHRV